MFKLLELSDTIMPFLSMVLYLLLWKQIDKKDRIWLAFFIYNILLYGYSNILSARYINNLYLYHIAAPLELVFAVFIIARTITGKNFSRQFIYISLASILFCIVDIIYWEPLDTFNSVSAGYAYLVTMIYCMFYLFNLSKSDQILHFQKLPSFWYVSAFLVYCTISLLAIASYRYFSAQNMMKQAMHIFSINLIAIIIKFAMISIGLLCYKRPNTQIRSLF